MSVEILLDRDPERQAVDTLKISPPRPLDENLTKIQIADLAGSNRSNLVSVWQQRFGPDSDTPFPAEDDYVGQTPVWRVDRIIAWMDATGRPHDLEFVREKKAAGGYLRPQSVSRGLTRINDAAKKTAAKKAATAKKAAAKKAAPRKAAPRTTRTTK